MRKEVLFKFLGFFLYKSYIFIHMLIKPGAHGRKQLSKKSREAVSSAVSSRVRVNFGEIFASRGREKKIYIVFDNFCLTKIYAHTGGNS